MYFLNLFNYLFINLKKYLAINKIILMTLFNLKSLFVYEFYLNCKN